MRTSHLGSLRRAKQATNFQRWASSLKRWRLSPWANCKSHGRAFLNQIISSAVDVDKQDFIVRDTYHTGAEYGFIDVYRLIHALDVLGENLAVELGALSALEAFMIARIESFKSIYFHRVGRAAQIMLATAMEKANDELGLTAFKTPEEYLALDDYTVWAALKKCSRV